MKLSKLLLATIGATVLLGALAGSASARTFSVSNQFLRTLFREVIFNGAFGRWICEVQLEGSLHSRTIQKRVGTLLGYITAARILRCTENTATILQETLPWHVRYRGFSGTLPNITDIQLDIVGFSFRIQEPFFGCLARSTPERPAVGIFNRNTTTRIIDTGEISGTVPTTCGSNMELTSNRAQVFLLNSTTTRIVVTLI